METLSNNCAETIQSKKKNTKSYRMKETLIQELPNCFKKGDEKQPLCIGIHIQLHTHYKDDARFDPKLIQQGLNKYCNSPKYIKNIIAGTPRIDIHGTPQGVIMQEEEADAKKRMQKLADNMQKKLQLAEEKRLHKIECDLQKKLMLEEKKRIKIKTIKKQIPIVKEEPKAIPLEELRKKASPVDTTLETSSSKEQLKLKKQLKYAKKMARKTTLRK